LKWSKIILDAAIMSIILFLGICLLSLYIHRPIFSAIPIIIGVFLSKIMADIKIYKKNSKNKWYNMERTKSKLIIL
jgi:hypothetical protein